MMKIIRNVLIAAAILLSDVMCAAVAYRYCDMLWGIRYAGYSAPAGAAFLDAIPFGVGMIICVALAAVFHKKANRRSGK